MLTNKHKICIAFICIGFAMAGCKKDLLNTLPNDRLSTEVFWKTENDARLAVNAAYPFLDDVNIFTWDALTDIAHTNQFFTNDATVEKGIYDATNSKMATEWSNAYRGIAAANFVLDNIDKIKTANAAIINQYKGEARTLRAYQYIKLASLFGGVPLVTKTINIEEGKGLARATVGQVWDFVDKELKESADLLPATHVAVDKGRITKGAALALQARANLYAGRFQAAADAASKVMAMNYNLYPQYSKLYTYAAENNAEVILDKQFIKDVFSNNVFAFLAPYSQKGSTVANWVVPTKKILDMYPMANGKSITDPSSGFDPSKPYLNRDPRLNYSIFLPGDILPDGKVFNPLPNSGTQDAMGSSFYATTTGATIKKYINNEDYAALTNSGINIILLRYAEVLLTYAEAKIELGQADQSVYDAINRVRQRGDVNLPPLAPGLSQSELRNAVRNERTIELAFEGHRLFDIRRWKIAETVLPGNKQGITYTLNGQLVTTQVQGFDIIFNKERDYLWPIPQKEKELNPGLVQNPNW